MENDPLVQLCCATLPWPIGLVAVHHWFVVIPATSATPERWEVWQRRQCCPTSWGYVHLNLKQPHDGVGGGPMVLHAEWRGAEAGKLLSVLRSAPQYRFRDRYWIWPGPNSNTFAAWVLREAGIDRALHPKAVGAEYSIR